MARWEDERRWEGGRDEERDDRTERWRAGSGGGWQGDPWRGAEERGSRGGEPRWDAWRRGGEDRDRPGERHGGDPGWREVLGRDERGRWRGDEPRGGEWPRSEWQGRGSERGGRWRGGPGRWREGGERWREAQPRRLELGREYGGRAEWDRMGGRERGWGDPGGAERGGQDEGGGWRRTSQYDPAGEGPGSWGPGGRWHDEGRRDIDRDRFEQPGAGYWGAGRPHRGETARDAEGWSDRDRDAHGWREDRDRDDRGVFERLGDRMREGMQRLTGRGPKGYRRSDDRIREDVCERIARSNVDAEDVEVKVENGEVTLSGTVQSRWDKRMLEDLAGEVFGVDEVQNQLRTKRLTERAAEANRAGDAPSEPLHH